MVYLHFVLYWCCISTLYCTHGVAYLHFAPMVYPHYVPRLRAAQIVGLSRHLTSFRIIFSESVFKVLPQKVPYFKVLRQKIPYFNVSRQKLAYLNVSQQKIQYFNVLRQKMPCFNVSRQKIPYFNVLRQKVPYFNICDQNTVP